MKPYLLQKLSPVGFATLSTIIAATGSMLVVPSANAALFDIGGGACGVGSTICEGTFNDFVLSPTTIGDKTFTFTSPAVNLPNPPETGTAIDTIDLEILDNGDFILTYDILPDFQGESFNFNYEVNINSDRFFTAVDLDSNVDAFSDTQENLVTEFDFDSGSQIITLTSFNGNSDEQNVENPRINEFRSVSVSNDYDLLTPGSGEISSFENSFRQGTHSVPEPTTILGLLTFGGLGLGLKRKSKIWKTS